MKRGCVEDLPPEESADCLSNSDSCKVCMEQNCNTRLHFQECYVCNSRSDPQCVKDPQCSDICEKYDSRCMVGVDSNGLTHRQCTVEKVVLNSKFKICTENNCNKEIFPADRLMCYQCSGDKKCDSLQRSNADLLKPEPCNVYSIFDQCFTYIDAGADCFPNT